jgi:hypothetical protein
MYDPRAFNDRLVLGMKGTLPEAEPHLLGARLRGGQSPKARRSAAGAALHRISFSTRIELEGLTKGHESPLHGHSRSTSFTSPRAGSGPYEKGAATLPLPRWTSMTALVESIKTSIPPARRSSAVP